MDQGNGNCFAGRFSCSQLKWTHVSDRLFQASCLCTAAYFLLYHAEMRGGQQQHGTWQCGEKGSMYRVL